MKGIKGIENEYTLRSGETPESYRLRLYKNQKTYGLNNAQVGLLCNQAFGVNYDESTHRKYVKPYLDGYNDACSEIERGASIQADIKEQLNTLEKEKVKFRDERNEWAKQVRNQARTETKFELWENALSSRAVDHFPILKPATTNGDNDLLVCLSDLHIGSAFSNFNGKYSSDIASERLLTYSQEIKKIKRVHGSKRCYITLLGDQINGNIHKTIAITNRENVIQQVELASQLIEEFVYSLAVGYDAFDEIIINGVSGNHSRIDTKDDALKDERLDNLIMWHLETSFKHLPNITVVRDTIDSTVALMEIRGKLYASVHGDYDCATEAGVSRFAMWLGKTPYCVLFGHMHTSMLVMCGINIVRSGSLAGSGDDYTLTKRMTGCASQTVLVCNSNGIVAQYPIQLSSRK